MICDNNSQRRRRDGELQAPKKHVLVRSGEEEAATVCLVRRHAAYNSQLVNAENIEKIQNQVQLASEWSGAEPVVDNTRI